MKLSATILTKIATYLGRKVEQMLSAPTPYTLSEELQQGFLELETKI